MSEKHQPSGKNSNCLDGMCCPDCGNEDELLIAATMFVSVKDDGTDPYASSVGDYSQDWDDTSTCRCPECNHVGTVGEFKGKDPEDVLIENSEPVSGRRDDVNDLAGALDSCLNQIHQMKGMFDDDDGAIQDAIDDAELALEQHRAAKAANSQSANLDLAPHGALSNMMDYILEHEGQSFSEELKSAGEGFAPVGITEDEWNEAIAKHEELIDQLARAKTREDSDKIESKANELFDHIARHTDGHIYCDAVRMRDVIGEQQTAFGDEHSTASAPRG